MLLNKSIFWTMFTVFLFCLGLVADSLGGREVVVGMRDGKIRGKVMRDRKDGIFYSFQSIPFAKPPVGPLRFKAPEAPEPWSGTLNGTKPAPVCVQYEFEKIIGEEDCLYLNVYTPTINTQEPKLSVMVYIHGGAYFEGSGSSEIYGPEFLMPKKIVLVTINYRLGRFGSLSFKDQSLGVPGNAHLKDQVMALQWVQKNIDHFGGDKNSVTIFGESVGGASVHMHMLSPMSKGLFHKAISQSGVALNAWNQGILGTGEEIAKRLNVEGKDTREVIQKLQSLPVERIMETQPKDGLGVPVNVKFEYSPVVETQENEPKFLTDLPINILDSGKFNKIPYIMGYNDKDSLIFQVVNRLYFGKAFYITDFDQVVPHDLNLTEAEKAKVAEEIRLEFYGNSTDFDDVEKFTKLALGPWEISAFYRSLIRHLKNSNSPIFYYVFSGDTKLNFFKRLHPVTAKYKGASHLDELGYLFKTKYSPCIEPGSPEDIAVNNIVKLWTNFAKFGDPTPKNSTIGPVWLPVTKETFNYMNIGTELEPGVNPDLKVIKFWHSLYKKYNGDFNF